MGRLGRWQKRKDFLQQQWNAAILHHKVWLSKPDPDFVTAQPGMFPVTVETVRMKTWNRFDLLMWSYLDALSEQLVRNNQTLYSASLMLMPPNKM